MDIKRNAEMDIAKWLKDSDRFAVSEKRTSLIELFNKHLEFNTKEHLLEHENLVNVVIGASKIMCEKRMPIHIGSRKCLVDQDDQRIVCIIEATIMELAKLGCLRKRIRFNYKDNVLED